MNKLPLGTTGLEVSALGLGCWPIGGSWFDAHGTPLSYGATDDEESIRAIHAAIDHGVNFFDTANVYGVGHSETVLGRAIAHRRDDAIIASKFSTLLDEERRIPIGNDASPASIRQSCEDSLRRLNCDYMDLLLFHDWGYDAEQAEPVRQTLESLVREGKIRAYGWSTDLLPSVKAFNQGEHNAAAEIVFNVFEGNRNLLNYCEQNQLVAMARSPLAMGLLSGRYTRDSTIVGDDIRTTETEWMNYFQKGKADADYLGRLDAVAEILRSDGRTLVQGALAWLWGKSDWLVPIPGFKNSQQAIENAKAMDLGPLSKTQVDEVERLIGFTDLFNDVK